MAAAAIIVPPPITLRLTMGVSRDGTCQDGGEVAVIVPRGGSAPRPVVVVCDAPDFFDATSLVGASEGWWTLSLSEQESVDAILIALFPFTAFTMMVDDDDNEEEEEEEEEVVVVVNYTDRQRERQRERERERERERRRRRRRRSHLVLVILLERFNNTPSRSKLAHKSRIIVVRLDRVGRRAREVGRRLDQVGPECACNKRDGW